MYKALIDFLDGEDGIPFTGNSGVSYKKGEEYPKKGLEVSPEHIQYLLGKDNKTRKPVIEGIPEKIPKE